jgi:hypothetical protein
MAVTVNGGAPSAPQIADFQATFQVAPSSHVSSGGAAHANAVAGGAAGFMTGADKTKLDGVAAGATANSSNATLLARANHTGTQTASTISDFNSASRAQTEAELVAGTNITITLATGESRTLILRSAGQGDLLIQVQASDSSWVTVGTLDSQNPAKQINGPGVFSVYRDASAVEVAADAAS